MDRPNILFIVADQFRADALGVTGRYCLTPNLDWVARRGTTFINAFCNSTECVPSRLSLATGLYPHQFGIEKNVPCTLAPSAQTWMQGLVAAGYSTAVFGKSHFHSFPGDLREKEHLLRSYGFQVVDETSGPRGLAIVQCALTDLWKARGFLESYRADVQDRFATDPFVVRPSPLPLDLYYDTYVGDAACNHLKHLKSGTPWFCKVGFPGPHEPWDAPEPYASLHRPDQMPAPIPRIVRPAHGKSLLDARYRSPEYSPALTSERIAAMRANYAGSVSLIDTMVGRIIDTVSDRGELDRTVIIFTSDHGEMNGDHGLVYKANFLDPALRVPLIISAPGAEMGQERSDLVELMDVGATVCDFSGSAYPRVGGGRSIRSLVQNTGDYEPRRAIVSEFDGHTCVVTESLKVEFNQALEPVLAFDRRTDRNETADLIDDPDYDREIGELRRWLSAFKSNTPFIETVVDQQI